MLQLESNSLEDLGELAKQIVNLTDLKVFAFYGEMGAGKTTLIKKIVEVLGSNDEVSSPTYSLVNEYFSETTGTIYHFDFYRIESEDEVFDIGYEDYLYSSHYCFIEWPEIAMTSITQPHHTIKLKHLKDSTRKISFI